MSIGSRRGGVRQQERTLGTSEILAADCSGGPDRRAGQQQWRAAIVALEELLLCEQREGVLVLSGPSPVLSHPELLADVATLHFACSRSCDCLPGTSEDTPGRSTEPSGRFRIRSSDPSARECFCLVLAPSFCLAMSLDPTGQFRFSFAPATVRRALQSLGRRLPDGEGGRFATIASPWENYCWPDPSYQLVTQFSQQLLVTLSARQSEGTAVPDADATLLQALTHEVRTPLTAIRLWTRLILKRRDLPDPVLRYLQGIDRECTAQIERMELLFQAAELAVCRAKPGNVALQPIDLAALLPDRIPHWQQIACRRQIDLDVALPGCLPTVLSDAALLDRTLASLLESYVAGVPTGSSVRLEIAVVGDRLKLQLSQPQDDRQQGAGPTPLREIGRLLSLHPETGNLTLNLNATRNLFQALGAKLTVRQHATQGAVLAVFLPLEVYSQHSDRWQESAVASGLAPTERTA